MHNPAGPGMVPKEQHSEKSTRHTEGQPLTLLLYVHLVEKFDSFVFQACNTAQ